MTTTGPDWFREESSLLAELRRTAVAVPPAPYIPGYEDLREVRRGGQGIVFSALQRSTRRKVAVKVLLETAESAATSRRRFEREVDLVASLNHPGIVDIYDSGVTDDGRPFLVMEFVEGKPLDQYIRAQSWGGADGVRPIVRLIAKVAEAVQYAHQRGVIHRDLKPSNIRVGDDGTPHVLDFGLARPLSHDGEATVSASGQFLGSLAWASPEQAGGDPRAIDVRTDIYSLGVILYQSAIGKFPYEVNGGLRTTLDHIARTAPARPAAAAPWIDSDLQAVMLKCLEKDPALRYQSAGELAADLHRWLAGEPVMANMAGAWSSLRAVARRHRRTVVLTAAALVVAGAVAVTMSVLYAKASSAEAKAAQRLKDVESAQAEVQQHLREAEAARTEAQQQAEQSETINAFLRNMLAAADPTATGRDAKVVTLLDRAARALAVDPKLTPLTRAALQQVIGGTYLSLGLYPAAEPLFQAAYDTRREALGPEHVDTITSLTQLGNLRIHQGRLEEAEKLLRDAAARADVRLTPDDRTRMGISTALGNLLYNRGNWNEAEAILRKGLEEAHAPGVNRPEAVGQLANSLAIVLRHKNKLDEAEQLYRTELRRITERSGPEHAFAYLLMSNLGSLLHQRGQFEEAERLYRAAVEGRERLLGPDHPDTLTTITNLAKFLADRQRFDESMPLYQRVLESSRSTLGPEHPTSLSILSNYAKALQDAGRLDESEELSRLAVELRAKVLGADHPNTMISLSNLATLMAMRGKTDEAILLQRDLLTRRERKLGEKAQDTLITVNNLGLALQKAGKPDEALPLFERATAGSDEVNGHEHWITGAFRGNLGRCLGSLNRLDEAERELLESHRVLIAKLGPDHAQAKQAVKSLYDLYMKLGKSEEAAKYAPAQKPQP